MPADPSGTARRMALQASIVIGLAAAAIAFAGSAAAQDGQAQGSRLAAGPYLLDVAVSQSRGDVHFTIAVEDAATGQPVTDAKVRVLAVHREAGQERTLPAKPVAPGRYQADAEFERLGRWEPTVEVDGPSGAGKSALRPLDLSAPPGTAAASYLFYGVVAAMVGGVLYLWWSARREQRKQQIS